MKLIFENVLARNGDFVLGPLDTSVITEKPQVVMILGANGAGKSTLLKVIAGFTDIEKGRITLDDTEVSSLPPQRRRVGLVSQEPYLFPTMSVEGNILFGARDKSIATSLIDTLGLQELIKRKPSELSGGEAQRVSIARALAMEPRILLMDEPFSHLDRSVQVQLRNIVKQIVETNGTDVMYVTHSVEEAYSLGSLLLFMDKGRLAESLSATGRLSDRDRSSLERTRPKTRKFAELLGYRNFISGKVVSGGDGVVDVKAGSRIFQGLGDEIPGKEVSLAVRPEDIVLSTVKPASSSHRNAIHARIAKLEIMGPVAEVLLQVDGQEELLLISLVTTNSVTELGLKVGQDIYALFKATACHIVLD
ncbi:MAG: ABC transporter ATP-binding protein [Nitrososphaerota archaeon]|nr:ABC transporter ATP-binding protein [Nitrososphaerota archaeon]